MYEYKPYTYIVIHRDTGYFYYGCKYANDGYTHPDLFWCKTHKKGYFTSSKLIHKMIEEYGLNSFDYQIRKIFTNEKETFLFEQKVIKRIIDWDKCLNSGVGGSFDSNKTRRIKINGISSYDKAIVKINNTKLIIGEDGLTTYQRAGLKIKCIPKSEKHIENLKLAKSKVGEDGLTLSQRSALKIMGDNNPSRKDENRHKISQGVKNYLNNRTEKDIEYQKLKHLEAMRSEKVREKLKNWNEINNPVRDTNWYNDGIKSYRLKDDDPMIVKNSLNIGRLPFKMIKKESICPHCGLIGKGGNMKRYHFDNCKNKKEII